MIWTKEEYEISQELLLNSREFGGFAYEEGEETSLDGDPWIDWAWWGKREEITPYEAAQLRHLVNPEVYDNELQDVSKIQREEIANDILRLAERLKSVCNTWTLKQLADYLGVKAPVRMVEACNKKSEKQIVGDAIEPVSQSKGTRVMVNYKAWALRPNLDLFTAAALWLEKNPFECDEWNDTEFFEVGNIALNLLDHLAMKENYPTEKILALRKLIGDKISDRVEFLKLIGQFIASREQLKEIALKSEVKPEFLFLSDITLESVDRPVDAVQGVDSRQEAVKDDAGIDCFNVSGLLNNPKRMDDWFEAIDDMTKDFYREYGKVPNQAQAWGRLCTATPDGYEIKVTKRDREEYLEMRGSKPLSKEAFNKRWKKYTTKKPIKDFKPQ